MDPSEALLTVVADEMRFGGIARLYGREGLRRLASAHVCVVGVGGVGSWTVEALARSGVGKLTLIDLDEICVTNINRQLPALENTVGRAKVEVLGERVRNINPGCVVREEREFFTQSSADRLLSPEFTWVVDAIDVPAHKCLLLALCRKRGIPVIAIGGAGGKRDATQVRVTDLGASGYDPLLKVVRRELRREYGVGIVPEGGPVSELGIPCVVSSEKPVYPWADGGVCASREEGNSLVMDCASGFGSATFVTGVFGFVAAGEVVRRIALEGILEKEDEL